MGQNQEKKKERSSSHQQDHAIKQKQQHPTFNLKQQSHQVQQQKDQLRLGSTPPESGQDIATNGNIHQKQHQKEEQMQSKVSKQNGIQSTNFQLKRQEQVGIYKSQEKIRDQERKKAQQNQRESKLSAISIQGEEKHEKNAGSSQTQTKQPTMTPEEMFEKQKLIYEILKLQDDFGRLEERSEELKIENQYFVRKIQEYQVQINSLLQRQQSGVN